MWTKFIVKRSIKEIKNENIVDENFRSTKNDKNKNVATHEKSKNSFRSRNRINLFITLIASSKNNNQINHLIVLIFISQKQSFVHSISISIKTIVHFENLFKIEKQTLKKLNILIRRYYMIFLINKMMTKSMREIFFDMKFNHKVFKSLIFRVKAIHKNWKKKQHWKRLLFSLKNEYSRLKNHDRLFWLISIITRISKKNCYVIFRRHE